MRHLGCDSCEADPDSWMKRVVRPDDGFECHACILLHVDDALCICHDATKALTDLDHCFEMKEGSIGDPDICLGAKVRQVQLDNGVFAWSMSPSKYAQEAVRNIEIYLGEKFGNRKLPTRGTGDPWPSNCSAELDVSLELTPESASCCQSQIGVLHWIVELGCADVVAEVSILASHMALPREGHLDAIFHIFACLKGKHDASDCV